VAGSKNDTIERPIVLITGGSGFLGAALVRELLGEEHESLISPAEVRILDTRPPRHDAGGRIRFIRGDVRSREDLEKACAGADLVFHCAAVIDWGQRPRSFLYDVNVNGTRAVIDAASRSGARGLVFTSSMDVLYDGRALLDADESAPYPEKFDMVYAETKAIAEREVLKANGIAGLRTCVIRPCGMFGEGDPYHVSSFLKMAMSGALRFRIGNGRALFQHVYVGNVAHAHVLAGKSLLEKEGTAAGGVYFITDFEARNFFDYMEPILGGIGYRMPPKKRSIPMPVMYALACVIEGASWLIRPLFRMAPKITRTSVNMVCKDLTFSCEKASRELGYSPRYSEDEAIGRTVEYFRANGPV
jgi:nucleoside-diphosphate-sugar epimerase